MSRAGPENRCETGVCTPRRDQKVSGAARRHIFNSAWRFFTVDQTLAIAATVSTVSTMQRFCDTDRCQPQSDIAPHLSLCSFAQALSSCLSAGTPSGKGFRSTLIAHENGCLLFAWMEFRRFHATSLGPTFEVAAQDVLFNIAALFAVR